MKRTNVLLLTALLFAAGVLISACETFEAVESGARTANESVRRVNTVIRDVDETVGGVSGAIEGTKDVGEDTGELLGIENQPQQGQSGGSATPSRSMDWPDNQFTRKVPRPNLNIASTSLDGGKFNVGFYNASYDQVKAYAASLKAAGYNNISSENDNLGRGTYSLTALNQTGDRIQLSSTGSGEASLIIE